MSDIYGYGGDPSYGGGTNLGSILGALGSLPMSVIKALYAKPGLPDTLDQRFGSMQQPSVGNMGQPNGPQIVGNAPQINVADIPQTQQPPIMNETLNAGGPNPSPIATEGQGGGAGPMAGAPPIGHGPLGAIGGGLFGGLSNLFGGPQSNNPIGAVLGGVGDMFGRMSMGGSPALQQQYYGRLIAQQMYQSLIARNVPPDQALAIVSNPALQQQYYGAPTHVGDVRAGGVEVPVLAGQGGIQYGLPGGGGGQGLDQLATMGARFSQQQKAAEAAGEQQGKNSVSLPNTATNLDTAIGTIDAITRDPATKSIIGGGSYTAGYARGTPAYDAYNRLQDLKGQLIPAAVQELQASGAAIRNPTLAGDVAKSISDVDAAEKGSPKAFTESMGRLRAQLVRLKANAYESAGQQAPAQMETPLSGTTQSGVRWSISH